MRIVSNLLDVSNLFVHFLMFQRGRTDNIAINRDWVYVHPNAGLGGVGRVLDCATVCIVTFNFKDFCFPLSAVQYPFTGVRQYFKLTTEGDTNLNFNSETKKLLKIL